MESSSLLVFSIIFNIKEIIKKDKNIKIDKLRSFIHFNNSKFLKTHIKRIWNEI